MGADGGFVRIEFGGARSRDHICRLKIGRKWTSIIYWFISVCTHIDKKRFLVFEHVINCSYGFSLFTSTWIPFFFFVSFFLTESTFKPPNVQYSNFERL